MSREWDAVSYDNLPLPHGNWSARTLAGLSLTGGETLLDAGAGTGRDVPELLSRLPFGRLIAVDGSQAMLSKLGESYADVLDRVTIVHADLNFPLPITPPVDAVYSVATFHWVHDHERLFLNIASILKHGGQFVAECGGQGCVAQVRAAIESVLGRPADATNFAGVADTREKLQNAGFTDIDVSLIDDPFRLEPGPQFENYLAAIVLGPYLDGIAPEEHNEFVSQIARRMGSSTIDYVRLNIRAKYR